MPDDSFVILLAPASCSGRLRYTWPALLRGGHLVSRIAAVYQGNRALVWLCVVIFVNQLGFGSVTPVVALYAQSFGVSVAAIGLSVAVYGLARFAGGVPTGQLSDRLGRRSTLVL